jgi:hypothetical protein
VADEEEAEAPELATEAPVFTMPEAVPVAE